MGTPVLMGVAVIITPMSVAVVIVASAAVAVVVVAVIITPVRVAVVVANPVRVAVVVTTPVRVAVVTVASAAMATFLRSLNVPFRAEQPTAAAGSIMQLARHGAGKHCRKATPLLRGERWQGAPLDVLVVSVARCNVSRAAPLGLQRASTASDGGGGGQRWLSTATAAPGSSSAGCHACWRWPAPHGWRLRGRLRRGGRSWRRGPTRRTRRGGRARC